MAPPKRDDSNDQLDLNPRYTHRRITNVEAQVKDLDGRIETLEKTENARQAISMWKAGIASFVGSMLAAVVAVIAIMSYLSGLRK